MTTHVKYYAWNPLVSVGGYSPFGAPLVTRNKQVSSVLVAKSVSESSFSSGVDGWVATSNATLSNVYGNIRATVTALNAGMQKTFSTEAGKTYRIRFKVNLRGWPYMYVKDVASTTNLISITDFMTPGDYSYTFTATGYQTNVIFHEAGNASGSVQLASFVLEEVEAKNGYRFGFNGKEKDNETYGEGNAYDYGARIYDSRLGRWLSVDPLQVEYPNLSPYNSFENNPIYFNDPDGKNAGYTIKGNTITFTAQIYISGKGATAEKAKEMQKEIMKVWGGKNGNGFKSGNYNVKFDIQVVVINPQDKKQQENFKNGTANIVSLVENPKESFRDYVKDGSTGIWAQNTAGGVRAHETGHMLGLDDAYSEVYTSRFPVPTSEADIIISQADYPDIKPNDVMASGAWSEKPAVKQFDIDALANYALNNKENVKNTDNSTSGKIKGVLNLGGSTEENKAKQSPKPLCLEKNKKR